MTGLRHHLETMHRLDPPRRAPLVELQRVHREQHHRYYTDHYHAGPNLGPATRPPGWDTGEDAVAKR